MSLGFSNNTRPIVGKQGSARSTAPFLAKSVLTTLAVSGGIAILSFGLFLALRPHLPRQYSPRTLVPNLGPQERTVPLPRGYLTWIKTFSKLPDKHVLRTQSLDGYLLLRLLKVSAICCLVGCIITWPVLFPVNATGAGVNQRQLNILTFSNVASPDQPNSYYRYYAHAFCAIIFFGFVISMIHRESIYYINLRQAYLVSPFHANRISSRTVLYTSIPERYLNENMLRQILGPSVVNIWIPRDITDLQVKLRERDDIAKELEKAEIKLVKTANAARLRAMNKHGEAVHEQDFRLNSCESETSEQSRWITPKQRPQHRLKFIVGKKVDSVEWCRAELPKKIAEVEEMQAAYRSGTGKPLNSAFVEFTDMREAQAAFQSLTHHEPLQMAPRFTDIIPEQVIWLNLRMLWWERLLRMLFSVSVVTTVILFFTVPVAAIGALANLTTFVDTYAHIWGLHWLRFLKNLPSRLNGIVTGYLPPFLLWLLLLLVPNFLRVMARFAGSPSLSDVEYTVQNTYFAFQVVQVFLVSTLSGGFFEVVQTIAQNPTAIPSILASSLPEASNFYLSYFIFQGLGAVGGLLLMPSSVASYYILGMILDSTPRKKFRRWMTLSDQGLGASYPVYTNLLVIAISYSCVAPLVLIFAAIGLGLFYLGWRYEFFYLYHNLVDTKGLMYARALQQIFFGLYLAELCLIGLFALGLPINHKAVLGPLILMAVMLVFTIIYHVALNAALRPLLKFLPKTIQTEEMQLLALEAQDAEEERSQSTSTRRSARRDNCNNSVADKDHDNGICEGDLLKKVPPEKQLPIASSTCRINFISNILMKWLFPGEYKDYYAMRQLVPRNSAAIQYDEATEKEAYYPPCVTAKPPVLWIPRDEGGVSAEEVKETSKVIRISDRGASLNSKNKIVWDSHDPESVPVYTKKIYY